jgi:hypothetical protein
MLGVIATIAAPTAERCAHPPPPPTKRPWTDEVERALRCDGRSDTDSRRVCFVTLLTVFNQWPDSDERRASFAEVQRRLNSWSHEQRAASASHVIHARDARVFDTMLFVRALEDWYPEDTGRDAGINTRLATASPFAEAVESYRLVRASVSFRWFAEGPGLSRLRSLELRECDRPERTFAHLLRWRGLATLERIALTDERALIEGDSLWVVAREAPRLRELSFVGYGAAHATVALERERELSQRLTSLVVRDAFVRTQEINSLVQNRSLANLARLDLRDNALTDADVRALREAPHFARTEVLTGRSRP